MNTTCRKGVLILFQLVSFVCLHHPSYSQNSVPSNFVTLQPIPPSPDAAKIAQFDLNPPNLYTGTTSVPIPIYQINLDGASIPICINYHSGGIRASENASWVGLGWALSTGGSISRTKV